MEPLTPSTSDSETNCRRGSESSSPESCKTHILGKRKLAASPNISEDEMGVRVGISAKSGGYEEDLQRNGFICLSSETHEITRTELHMPDMSCLVDRLKKAYENRRNSSHYHRVAALLLQFEDDDLGVASEIRDLAGMFGDTYHFAVDVFRIPSSKRRHFDLLLKVDSFLAANDYPGSLCIVYYGGHATKEGHTQPIWVSNRQRDVEVDSSMILPLFKERDCDIWLLFDSCQAMPNAFNTTGKGVVAALAATGFEPGEYGVAPDVGSHSFTHTLVQVLGQRSVPSRPDEGPRPFTDVSLHSQMLTELSKWPVYLQRDRDGSYKRSKHGHHVVEPCRRRTPIYQFLSRNKAPKPIYICPMPDNSAKPPSHGQPQLDSETGDCSSPHVLISVRLGTDHLNDADIRTVVNCLHSIPGADGINAPMVTFEAIYPSLSTLLILRMPLALWDLLPKDESMNLIGYITGANYAHSFRDRIAAAMGSMPETESTKMEECQSSNSDSLGLEVAPSQQEISCYSARIVASQENVCQPSLSPDTLSGPFITDAGLPAYGFVDEQSIQSPKNRQDDPYVTHSKNDRMQESEDCLKSLAFPEMDSRLRSFNPLLDGTCTWLFNHRTYKQWASSDSSLLWIQGKPGTGKSVLMRHMVDSLLKSGIDEPNTCAIYFFFNSQGTELQKTPLGLFRSLLHQLSSWASNTTSDLASTFARRSGIIGKAGEKWHWNLEELQGFFKSSLSEVLEQRKVWLLIDALDECDGEGVAEVASYFKSLQQEFPSSFHICISSRSHQITDALGGYRIVVEVACPRPTMVYPSSIAASALVVITATAQTTSALYKTVTRYRERHKMLHRLQGELEDLGNILQSLEAAVNALDDSMWMLLEGPVTRCNNVCSEFEAAMQKFSAKSKMSFRDWAMMKFMRGDINTFIDTLAGYKAMINIALGTITMNTSKITRDVLDEYHEVILDTIYDLQVRFQRIENEITHQRPSSAKNSDAIDINLEDETLQRPSSAKNSDAIDINLEDEKEVINQCLRICEDARSHLKPLQIQEPPMMQGMLERVVVDRDSGQFVVTTLEDVFRVRKVSARVSPRQLVGSLTNKSLFQLSGFSQESSWGSASVCNNLVRASFDLS